MSFSYFSNIFSPGKCFEVKSVDSGCTYSYCDGGALFNFFKADTELVFDGTSSLTATVDHYRNGERINASVSVYMYPTTTLTQPDVGDGYGYTQVNSYTPGKFETGDFLCLFPGETTS